MNKPLTITICTCLATLTLGAIWGGMGLTRIGYTALERWGNAAPDIVPTLAKANATLDAINAPCTGFHGAVTCGPLAQLSQTEKNVGILAGKSALQVQQTGALVTAVASNLDTVGDSVKQVAGRLSGTADAATGTLNAATYTLQAVNERTPALMDAYTGAGRDLDAMIKANSPSVKTILSHGAGMSASGDVMLSDAQWKTHQLLHPDKVKLGLWGTIKVVEGYIHTLEPPIL